MAERSIVVVGAGIVGSSLAYHLSGQGRPVTLIDAGLPGSGVTRASFAWIGRPVSSDRPSAPLRYLALDEYRRLEAELPGLSIRWTGSLVWDGFDDSPGTTTDNVHALEPQLVDPPAEAIHHPEDAAFDPVAASELLTATARDRGARLMAGTQAIAVEHEAGTITGVRTSAGTVAASTVVLAAGTGSVALCAGVGVTLPVEPSPAILVRLRATPGLVRAIIATPSLEARQLDDGTVLAPTAYTGETDQAALLETAKRVRDRFAASFKGAGDAGILSVEIGWRPMPVDDEPIIGTPAGTQGLYVAVMHSGITLAAAVGRLAASEILTNRPVPELEGCRPTRFD
ncbi:NAD(P)/FAD-dependent oxidoreductase [Kribbella italica]|uniref:Glycine/D-amino acid oxidase-like deaminating enzyme n=1 Tax=Kribbella italica TaxID=1540520 RepID=A0A7W9J9C9_9ACTN|nr:FAD-binding oxidoreductase [Kribbella italica]MBB5837565.1 glycine/D-amino acid oxidase-like deaminating enzyme [Kribbella italica]